MQLHPKHEEWLAKRGIQSDTAALMKLETRSDDQGNWIVFPYVLAGKLVNRKYRLTQEKRHKMDQGGTLCLWNAECLRSDRVARGASVIVTEGEFDALIAMECGFLDAVSVPNGAPTDRIDDPANSNRYRFLYESEKDLEGVAQFVLAVDGDEPGRALAHDLAAILGAERCKFVTYPDGTKDLNEVFLRDGPSAVTALINSAKPYPVRNLYRMDDFPEAPPVQGMKTGIDVLDDMMQVVMGTLTVFTGYSNMGKSTVINTIAAHAIGKAVPVCIASFETAVKPILREGLAKALIGCSNREFDNSDKRAWALGLVDKYVGIISNANDEDDELDIDAFLELARIAVVRDGVKLIVLDPWNELEHKRLNHETMTEYIGRAIRKVKAFARRYGVSFWIVAHPTKPSKGVNEIPSLYDISDSSHWANKADYGLVYHRPVRTENEAKLAVVKVRMGLPGKIGVEKVKFDHRTNRVAAFAE